jgi:hypothetical protein
MGKLQKKVKKKGLSKISDSFARSLLFCCGAAESEHHAGIKQNNKKIKGP